MKRTVSLTISFLSVLMTLAFAFNVTAAASIRIELNDNNTSVIMSDEEIVYNGEKQTPKVKIYYGEKKLKETRDYTLKYSDNKNASSKATITINGQGKYIGTVTHIFKIARHSIAAEDIEFSMSRDTYRYSGEEKTPKITLILGERKLKKDRDFTVAYSNNIAAGKATVKVKGIGNYKGSIIKNYDINPLSLKSKKASVSISKDTYFYNGNEKKPKVTVSYLINGETVNLVKGTDYSVEYKNNKNTGRATVTVTGLDNYSKSVDINYVIKPAKVKGVKVRKTTNNSVTLKWKKSEGAISGYEILKYNESEKRFRHYSFLNGSNTLSTTINNLEPGKTYKFVVKGFKVSGDKKYFSKESKPVKTCTKPSKVTLKSVSKNKDKKTVKVKWNKVNCTGYELFYTTDKNFKKNIKTIDVGSKTSYTFNNLDMSKEYYIKVRAYKKYDDKIKYGKKSATLGTYYSNVYATYYSWYENNPNRTNNLRLASKKISGTILQPGETFNFNKVVGPRTASRGYRKAHVFQGDQVVTGIGGGICQVASTLFNCTLKANFKIVERHQHDQRVAYVPLGRDAAIYGNAENYRFTNTSKHAVRIVMKVKDGKISATFYTCADVKPKKVKLNVYQSGNHFTLKRVVDGKVNFTCYSTY